MKEKDKKFKRGLKNTAILFAMFFIIYNLSFTVAHAASLSLTTSKNSFHQKEEFFVDIYLSPDIDEDVNAFDITLSYSSSLTFVKSEEGASVVGLFVQKPKAVNNTISFSGVMPGGFKGLIDPSVSNPVANMKSGLLTRLFFVGDRKESATISFSHTSLLANDGAGTALPSLGNSLVLSIDDEIIPSSIATSDINKPDPFTVFLLHDPLIFNGKYAIVFQASDRESGIDHYEVKEEGGEWKKAESPYLLSHQPPKGMVTVKAVDQTGNSTISELNLDTEQIDTMPTKKIIFSVVLILLIFIIFALRRKKAV